MTMASFSISAAENNRYVINGELIRQSINGKQDKHFKELTQHKNQNLDLSGINKIDTAGLAWLIALFEEAQRKQIEISYSQPPLELVKLAKLSGIENLLPIVNE
ncbi:lipid asymmetry maintenance protein MlaB [Thalassotalea crassostreae]|uniref:STAS domain-containing protein n=1 Tax=Thalassotalea crassostreae TaxID=1763536 RepID=UPI0009EEA742|nr:STAS domain-containing protein [Thalassotalea crassostreae]